MPVSALGLSPLQLRGLATPPSVRDPALPPLQLREDLVLVLVQLIVVADERGEAVDGERVHVEVGQADVLDQEAGV